MAMTKDLQRPYKPANGGNTDFLAVKLAGITSAGGVYTIYKGAFVGYDVSLVDGYALRLPATAKATGDIFAGIAMERVALDSSDTVDGAKTCRVARDGQWGFPKGSITITDIAATVYASDDGTITLTQGTNMPVGRIVEVDDTYVWIEIDDFTMTPMA